MWLLSVLSLSNIADIFEKAKKLYCSANANGKCIFKNFKTFQVESFEYVNIQFHRKLWHRNRLSITFQSLHKLLKFSKFSPLPLWLAHVHKHSILALPDGQNTESTLDTTRRRGVFSSCVFDHEIFAYDVDLWTDTAKSISVVQRCTS